MIPRTAPVLQQECWQQLMADSITSAAELLEELSLTPEQIPDLLVHISRFPLRVPRSFVRRMKRGDPHDPLLRQILPLRAEETLTPGFSADPVGDLEASAGHGLIRKYHGRALLITTGACTLHCRYCFRRHFPYQSHASRKGELDAALACLSEQKEISEIILSGGDPLSLTTERLGDLINRLAAIPHLERLRIHTRLPVIIPERLDTQLVNTLTRSRLIPVMVVHANHPREINDRVEEHLKTACAEGITLLNQSVLLRGINDDSQVLARLSERLFKAGVMPYYLHLLDRSQGTAHFDVPEARSRSIYQELIATLPGYLVPRMVREIAGAPGKTPVYPPL